MITKKQIEAMKILGMTFLTMYQAQPDAGIDMMNCSWNLGEQNLCGTTACHAGWFAVARNKRLTYDIHKRTYDFGTSASDMARFLGFANRGDLENWAASNEKLWGNGFGAGMFSDASAFLGDNAHVKPLTLEVIGKYWLKVAARIEKFKSVA